MILDDGNVLQMQELGGYDHWNKHFTFLCSMIWPLIVTWQFDGPSCLHHGILTDCTQGILLAGPCDSVGHAALCVSKHLRVDDAAVHLSSSCLLQIMQFRVVVRTASLLSVVSALEILLHQCCDRLLASLLAFLRSEFDHWLDLELDNNFILAFS